MRSRYYCYYHSPALRLLPNVCWYQTPLFSWTCSTQLVAEQSHSTQWQPSAKRDSVSVSAAAHLLSASGFGLWLYPEDRRSQALDHPLRLLLQGQVCLRLTGYLKKGCFEPLAAGPAHPPCLIRQCWGSMEKTGARICRGGFKYCLLSLFTVHLTAVLLSLNFLICEMGIIHLICRAVWWQNKMIDAKQFA